MEYRTSHNSAEQIPHSGSFSASPTGLIGTTLSLDNRDGHIGTLDLTSPGRVRLEASEPEGRIERISLSGYRLRLGEMEVTATREGNVYELRSEETVYEAKLNPLKNSAWARSSDDDRIEVRGGLLRQSYEVVCQGGAAEDPGAAVLLLYLTATLRRRAFTM